MKPLNILHLYPNELNTYGDHGNALTLMRRAQMHGFAPKLHYHHPARKFPAGMNLVIGGGGQDSAQADVQADILRIGPELEKLATRNVPMLMVCGTYQLFGHWFLTAAGQKVGGIGIFDAETVAGPKRMIGNVAIETEFGILYGFENHSGQTLLAETQAPFGKVLRGGGNNGRDKSEGARTRNVFGTYLHGPIMPNNPHFADELIRLAAIHRYGEFQPKRIDDRLAELARAGAKRRKY